MGSDSAAGAKEPIINVVNLRQALKLSISLVLFYAFALVMNWDVANYGSLAIVLVSLGTTGATLEKGIARVIGTTFGVVIGFLVLGLFSHDRWATLLAFSCYLAFVSYFMQGSRYSYAWFVAAFVPLVIWGDNYPNFQNAFYFGTFRWLQTTTGIVIYTLVDLVLWPRSAGAQFQSLGTKLWKETEALFDAYRNLLKPGQSAPDISKLRSNAAGTLASAIATLQQALLDTPAIQLKRRQWRLWESNTTEMCNALELWSESIADIQSFDIDRVLPSQARSLDTFERRINLIGKRWDELSVSGRSKAVGDESLLDSVDLAIDTEAAKSLSHVQRAALLCYVEQLKRVDSSSRALLESLDEIVGRKAASQKRKREANTKLAFQSTPWIQQRLWHSMFPVVAFVSAFLCWIIVNPPTGPKVPMFAGIISLVIVRTPMNPIPLVRSLILSVFLAVAPVYWLIMPALSTGEGLLCLVFVYSLIFGYLGERNMTYKMGPLVMFVNMTGISNQQSYSFQGPVDGALMVIVAAVFVAVSYAFFSPLHPGQALVLWINRFANGCARSVSRFGTQGEVEFAAERAVRLQSLQSMVLPAPKNFKAATLQIERAGDSSISSEDLHRLNDCMQRTANRIQTLEIACDRAHSRSPELSEVMSPILNHVHDCIQVMWERWAEHRADLKVEPQLGSLVQASEYVEHALDDLQSSPKGDRLSEQAWVDVYTVLGSLRGLIDAMTGTQNAMNRIDWQRLATNRF